MRRVERDGTAHAACVQIVVRHREVGPYVLPMVERGQEIRRDRRRIRHSLEITRDCNAVVCCSFNEALPLYVIEGMCSGHVVLRNGGGGMEEQLDDGVNGFRIDSTDIRQFARILEQVLNKKTMTDARLQAMGRASQELVARLLIPSYVDALEQARVPTTST